MSVSFASSTSLVTEVPVNDGSVDDRGVSLMALDQYMREMRRVEHLTKGQERVLFQRIERARREPANQYYAFLAKDARNRIIENYLPMVLKLVRKYVVQCSGMDWLDLVQEANLRLFGAIDRYHLGFEATFSTWAYIHVSMQLSRLLREKGSFIHVPEYKHEQLKKLLDVEQRLFVSLRREPAVADIAQVMGMPEGKIRELLALRRYEQVSSLQALLFEDESLDERPFYNFYACGNDGLIVEEEVVEREVCMALHRALLALPERVSEMLRLYYGLGGQDQRLMREIAAQFGVSDTVVASALRKGRKMLEEQLRPFYQEVA